MQLATARSDVSPPDPLRESYGRRVLGDDPWVVEAAERGPRYGIKAYTAREWDPEIDLYYYRARYYDPEVGRFIGEDPLGFKAGPNFYAYVMNRPVRFMDPFGLGAVPPKEVYDPNPVYSCPPGTTCMSPLPPGPKSCPCQKKFHWGYYLACVGSTMFSGGAAEVFLACLGVAKKISPAAGYVCSFTPVIAGREQCAKAAFFCDEEGGGAFPDVSSGGEAEAPPPPTGEPPPY